MIGILFFSKERLEPAARKSLLGYVVRVAVINLFIGLRGGIDNMAHVGGMVTGLVIGSLLVLSLKWPSQDRAVMRRNIFVAAFVVLTLLFVPLRAAKNEVVYAYRGEAALERKDFSKAIASFQQITASHPNDPYGHGALAYAYQKAKQYPQALAEYQRSLALAPDQPDTKINIAEIYTIQGKAQDAIPLFEANMSKVKMDAESYRLFAEALIQNREGERAENMLKNSLKLDAGDPETHTDMAKALRMQGRTLEANVEMNTADELRKKATSPQEQVKP
jgi:Flp pilus assembly protein TadD